jgi:hypothetical protein
MFIISDSFKFSYKFDISDLYRELNTKDEADYITRDRINIKIVRELGRCYKPTDEELDKHTIDYSEYLAYRDYLIECNRALMHCTWDDKNGLIVYQKFKDLINTLIKSKGNVNVPDKLFYQWIVTNIRKHNSKIHKQLNIA